MDRIGILVELMGDKAAISQIKEIKEGLDGLKNGVKIDIKTDLSGIQRSITAINKNLRAINQTIGLKVDTSKADKDLKDTGEKVKETKEQAQKPTTLNIDTTKAERNVISLKDAISSVGQAISSLGDLSSSIGSIFNSDILDTILHTVEVLGTLELRKSLSSGLERYDIMTTYDKYLALMGYSKEQADASLARVLDEKSGILGLPIQTSDIAYQIRLWDMYRGNIAETTELALGFNKALIAGGANEQMRTTAEYEVMRLLTVGELSTARQWNALLQGLGISTKYLKEEMGYANLETSEFANALAKKEISTEDFVQGLVKLASSNDLDAALNIYRNTIESARSNLEYAFTRGWEETLQTLNKTLESTQGQGIVASINNIRDSVDEMFDGIQKWIEKNPDKIEQFIDKILAIFNKLREFDWGGLANMLVDSFGKMVDIILKLYDAIPPDMLKKFLTFALVWASPLGKALKLLGSAISLFAKLIPTGLISKIGSALGTLFGFGGKVTGKNALTGIGSIAAFIGIIGEIGAVIWEYAEIFNRISSLSINWNKVSYTLGQIMDFVSQAMLWVGGFTAGLAVLSAATGGASTPLIFLAEGAIAAFVGIIAEIGGVIAGYVGVFDDITSLVNKIGNMDLNWTRTKNNVAQIGEVVLSMCDTFSQVTGSGYSKIIGSLGIESVASSFVAVCQAMEKIKDAKIPSKAKLNRIMDFYETLEETLSANFFKSLFESIDSLNKKNSMGNLKATMDILVDTIDTVKTASDKIDALDDADFSLDDTMGFINDLAEDITDLYTTMEEGFGDGSTAVQWNTLMYAGTMKNFDVILQNIGDIMDTLSIFDEKLDTLGVEGNDRGVDLKGNTVPDKFNKLTARIEEVIIGIQGMTKTITEDGNALKASVDVFKSSASVIIVNAYNAIIDEINNIMDTLSATPEKTEKIGANGINADPFSISGVDPFTTLVSQIREVIMGVQSFVDQILPQTHILFTASEIIRNYAAVTIVNAWDSILASIQNIMDSFNNIDFGTLFVETDGETALDTLKEKISTMIDAVKEIQTLIVGEDEENSLWGALKALWSSSKQAFNTAEIGALAEVMSPLTQLATYFNDANTALGDLDGETIINTAELLGQTVSSLKKIFTEDMLEGMNVEGLSVDSFTNMNLAMYQIRSVMTTLATLKDKVEAEAENDTAGKLKTVIENIRSAFRQIPTDMDVISENVDLFKESLESIKSVLGTLISMQETITTISDAGGVSGITTLITDLATALDTLSTVGGEGGLTGMGEGLESIAIQLQEIGDTDLSAIIEYINQLKAAMDALRMSADVLKIALLSVRNACNALGNAITALRAKTAQAGIFSALITSAYALRSALGSAASSAIALRTAINSIPTSKSISVNYATTRSTTILPAIKRAKGGIVDYTPSGTDTVPAMLTPGEFVMRKKAVQTFGTRFMEQLNSMNIDGAMQSLMSRFVIPQASTVINNSVDNHATVNQYINTPNPSYTYRRASRYVRAL